MGAARTHLGQEPTVCHTLPSASLEQKHSWLSRSLHWAGKAYLPMESVCGDTGKELEPLHLSHLARFSEESDKIEAQRLWKRIYECGGERLGVTNQGKAAVEGTRILSVCSAVQKPKKLAKIFHLRS